MNTSKRFSIILLSLFLIISCLPISAMAEETLADSEKTNDQFFYLEGIAGELDDPTFSNWIEARSFTVSTVEIRRTVYYVVKFKHIVDPKLLPIINDYFMNNKVIATGECVYRRNISGNMTPAYRIKMSDITIDSTYISTEDKPDGTYDVIEEITLMVGKLTFIAESPLPESIEPSTEDSQDEQFDPNHIIAKVMASNIKVKSIKPYKKSMTVKWKPSKYATGYKIKYSTNKNFKNSKTITVAKAKASSKKIDKLRRHKRYYVKIRAYHKNNGLEVYSAWGPSKSAKTY